MRLRSCRRNERGEESTESFTIQDTTSLSGEFLGSGSVAEEVGSVGLRDLEFSLDEVVEFLLGVTGEVSVGASRSRSFTSGDGQKRGEDSTGVVTTSVGDVVMIASGATRRGVGGDSSQDTTGELGGNVLE